MTDNTQGFLAQRPQNRIFLKFRAYMFFPLILTLIYGCSQESDLQEAKAYIKQSQIYYNRAVGKYKTLINKGRDQSRLHFELGELYFWHGEFQKASEEFRASDCTEAKKFLAISYFRMNNFTDALEMFDKQQLSDDEYLYYYGLTCERLNLFDKALDIYRKIKASEFKSSALERLNIIEKQAKQLYIKDLSPKVSSILMQAPSPQKYPNAGVFILSCDETIEVTSENTQVSDLYYLIKILNERGKKDFSEITIDYDTTYERIELEYARTIKPDGTVVEVGTRHIRDVSKYLNFPLYSNVHVYIISFPEITEGAVIEYKLKIYRNQLVNKKDLVVNYSLQTDEPVVWARFSIILPKDKKLHFKNLNENYNDFGANLKPNIKQEGNRLIYSWQFKDIPQIIPETFMPPYVQINPTFLASTFNSWQEIYDWWWALAKDKIKADNAIKEKVKQLTQSLDSPEEKIRAIYNFCAQKIRYVAVAYGEAGYEPHKAEDIFKNKYGDCKDQAILLVTMLKEADFSAWPVLIATKGNFDLNEDFPALLFNHCIVAVLFQGRIIFFDPTAETCSFDDLPISDQNRKVLIFKEDGYKIQDIPLYSSEHNFLKQHLFIKVNKDETITGEKTISTYGIYDQSQRYWLLYMPPDLIEEEIKKGIQDISIGASLDKHNIKNLDNLNKPVVLSYVFHGPEFFTSAGNLRILPQLTRIDTDIIAKDKRKYPLDLGILESQETIFEIAIPDNFGIKYIPESITESTPWGNILIEYIQKGNKICFRQKTEFKTITVPEVEYAEFKKSYEKIAKKGKQRIVIEQIK